MFFVGCPASITLANLCNQSLSIVTSHAFVMETPKCESPSSNESGFNEPRQPGSNSSMCSSSRITAAVDFFPPKMTRRRRWIRKSSPFPFSPSSFWNPRITWNLSIRSHRSSTGISCATRGSRNGKMPEEIEDLTTSPRSVASKTSHIFDAFLNFDVSAASQTWQSEEMQETIYCFGLPPHPGCQSEKEGLVRDSL